MEESRARIVICLHDGRFEIEGSESFVSGQVEKLEAVIQRSLTELSRSGPERNVTSGDQHEVAQGRNGSSAANFDQYQNVFAFADQKVQVLKSLPGANKSEKMVNAAILLAYAHSLQGNETTTSEQIRALCRGHGCLDSSNFAAVIKAEKETFVFSGSGRATSVTLTVPGKKRARALADSLNIS